MIRYNEKNTWKEQIEEDIKELTNYKASYNEKNKLYSFYLMIADIFKNGNIEYNKNDNLNKQEINEKIKVFNEQIQKIDTNLNTLSKIIEKWNSSYEIDLEEYIISEYNQEYKEITKNYSPEQVNGLFERARQFGVPDDVVKQAQEGINVK